MIANEDMAAAWDGDEGAYWADNAEHFEGSTRAHNARLQTGAAIAPGERVLDVGCGNGASTRAAAGGAPFWPTTSRPRGSLSTPPPG